MKNNIRLLINCFVIAFTLSACDHQRLNVTTSPSTPAATGISQSPLTHGQTFTTQEAELPEIPDTSDGHLAYISGILEKDGQRWITIDPVRFVDCLVPKNAGQPLPKGCGQNGPSGFFIDNAATTTETFEIAPSSGPYFLNVINGDYGAQVWRTMDMDTMQALLNKKIDSGSLLDEYYDPSLTNQTSLFFYEKKGALITKVYQKYFE